MAVMDGSIKIPRQPATVSAVRNDSPLEAPDVLARVAEWML
jgi:hypothetical protein